MEGGSTFTIGKGFGQMLQRIAWEKLTEKYNPREAVEIITKSLLGCTEGMAVDILDGKIILGEDEATHEVLGTPGAGGKFNDWIREQRIHLEEEAKEWVWILERLRQTIADAGGKFEFSVRYPELISYLSGDKDAGLLDYPRSNVVEEIKGTVEGAKNFFVKVSEVYEVIVWMCDALNMSRVILPDPILSMHTILDSLMCSDPEVEASIRKQDFQKQRLSEWMEEREENQTELEPVEITEGYDAGWLSPDGDFYGLNGSTENLLHLNIAERLLASKKIPVKEMRNPDRWLEENGWVKVHHDWILFSGSFYGKTLTEAQIEKLYRYGQVCHRGVLRLGTAQTQITAVRFRATEPLMLNKLLN
uniref:hypothetical protein n=1 Tax=Alistipes putredinis TaxID=28117 RepID=UPI003FD6EA0C